MLCWKHSKPPGKLCDCYNTCRESISLVLDVCRCGDIPPGLRHLLLMYPKAVRNSIDGHQNARKQVYRRLYGLLLVKQRDLFSVHLCLCWNLFFCTVWIAKENRWRSFHTSIPPGASRCCTCNKVLPGGEGVQRFERKSGKHFAVYLVNIYPHTLGEYLPTCIIIYHVQVYWVTMKDLSQAKWPALPK